MDKMAYKKNKKKKNNTQNGAYLSVLSAIFIYTMFFVFPLFYHHYYFNILRAKFAFYCVMAVLLLVFTLIYGISRRMQISDYIEKTTFTTWFRSFLKPDLFMIVFLIACTISTLQSDYIWEALTGKDARFTGLFLMLLYGSSYFIITRNLKFKENFLDVFLFSGILVSLFGITDYFQMNLLGFKNHMMETQRTMYTSTIGNINIYTGFLAFVIGTAFILFATAKDKKKTIYYYIAVVISFFAIIMGVSDNAYLSFMALFGFAPLYLFKNRTGVKRYLILVFTFFAVTKAIHYIDIIFADKVVGIDSLFNYISDFKYLTWILIGLLLFILFLHFYPKIFKEKDEENRESIGIWLRGLWAVVLVLCAAGLFYVIYKTNTESEWGGALTSYLRFIDSWGTNRGYIWRKAMELFNDFSIPRKLFGYGPDTFGLLMKEYNFEEMTSRYNVIFDNAHNEYLQYLMTVGIAGLASYVLFIGSAFVYMAKKSHGAPHVMAIIFASFTYCIQAVVNLNVPITVPVLMTLIAAGVAFCRNEESLEGW